MVEWNPRCRASKNFVRGLKLDSSIKLDVSIGDFVSYDVGGFLRFGFVKGFCFSNQESLVRISSNGLISTKEACLTKVKKCL